MSIKYMLMLICAILMNSLFVEAHNHLWPEDNDNWYNEYKGLLVNYEKDNIVTDYTPT